MINPPLAGEARGHGAQKFEQKRLVVMWYTSQYGSIFWGVMVVKNFNTKMDSIKIAP